MTLPAAATAATGLDLDHPIAAHGLHLAYGKQQVLRGVDLRIDRGEVVGLIGRNGAGKSTLLGCLLGLLQPAQGQALVMGAPALALDDARKARVAYVPQQPQAFGWMRVQQLCDYLAQLYPQWDRTRASQLLERWQLDPKKQIAKLSPGQAQRLAVVRALVPRPDLLVLDEPASALDPVARRELLREIINMTGQDGTTVLLSTHIVSDLERVASRVAFLHEGRMLIDQPLDELKDQAARVLVPAAYAKAVPADMPGLLARHVLDDGTVLVVLRADARLHESLLAIDGLRVDRLGLEDLFVEIAG